MKWYVRHWYSVNLIFIPILAVVLILNWGAMEVVQRLVVLNLMALLVHQFEEYGWPGGGPMVMNCALQRSDLPDRYPLNPFSAMFTNVFVGVFLYGLPALFPQTMWLVLVPMLFNFGQLVMHGVVMTRTMKTYYSPGLGAVVFLHLPISVYFFWYALQNHLLHGMDWLIGVPLAILCGGVFVGIMTYVLFPTRKTKWVFSREELERFHVREKMERIGVDVDAPQPARGPFLLVQKLQRRLHPDG